MEFLQAIRVTALRRDESILSPWVRAATSTNQDATEYKKNYTEGDRGASARGVLRADASEVSRKERWK